MSEGENQAKNEAVTDNSAVANSCSSNLAGDCFSSPSTRTDSTVSSAADHILLARATFNEPPTQRPEQLRPDAQRSPQDSTVNRYNPPLADTHSLTPTRQDYRALNQRQREGFYGTVQNNDNGVFPFFAQERQRPGQNLRRDLLLPTAGPQERLERLGPTPQGVDRPEIQEIINASQFYNGAILWHGTKYERAVSDGRFASAAAVSRVLQDVGYNYADSSRPANLLNKLIANGWEVVGMNQRQPGDVVIGGRTGTQWRQGNDNAVAGIVGADGRVFSTSGQGGQWTQGTFEQLFPSDQYRDQIWVLRPPQGIPPINDFSGDPRGMVDPREMSDQSMMPPGRMNFDQFQTAFRGHVQRDFNGSQQFSQYDPRPQAHLQQPYQPNEYRFNPQQLPDNRFNPNSQQMGPMDGPPVDRPPPPPPGVNVYDYLDAYYRNKWEQYYRFRYERGDFNRQNDRTVPGDRTQGPEIIDGPRSQQRSAQIYDLARRSVGRRLWETSDWADRTDNGRNGSASSVGELLKQIGFSYAHQPGTASLSRTLLRHGWQPTALQNLRAGDVIYGATQDNWENVSGNASSMAIVGENGFVYMCDRSTGQWRRMRLEQAFPPEQYGRRIWAMRAPERDVQPAVADPPRRRDRPEGPYTPEPGPRANVPSASATAIAEAAVRSNGQRMWRTTGANLGCAESISNVLKAAGNDVGNHTMNAALFDALQQRGWQVIQSDRTFGQAQPGDVVFAGRAPGMGWRNIQGGAHAGVVGTDGNIYSNNSRSGVMIGVDKQRFTRDPRYQSYYILRPPGNDGPPGPQRRPGPMDRPAPGAHDGPEGQLTPMQRRIAEVAGGSVVGGRGGWCARAVKADLDRAGLNIRRIVGSANAWDMGQRMLRSGEWQQIPSQNARPGDVLVLHDPNYVGDIRIVKSRQGDRVITVNDLRYGAEPVTGFDGRYRKYDRGIFLRYVGDAPRNQQSEQAPPQPRPEPQYRPGPQQYEQPAPYERMPYQRPYQHQQRMPMQIPGGFENMIPPQLRNRIPQQFMQNIPQLMNMMPPGLMRRMPPGFMQQLGPMFNQFGPQQYGPEQYGPDQFGPEQYGPDQELDPFGEQDIDPNERQENQEQEEQQETRGRQDDSGADYWNYYNIRRRGYEQYQEQYQRQQRENDTRRQDSERQQQQQQDNDRRQREADAERQRDADRQRQDAERERQRQNAERERERQRMEAERNRNRR